MTFTKPTVAFFGATGGCVCAALVDALKAGYQCSALVRTPAKLTTLLEQTHNVPAQVLANLTVAQGNIKVATDAAQVLKINNRLVDFVISGVGGSPKLQFSPSTPITADDPNICGSGMASVVSALRTLKQQGVPGSSTVLTISTTGITDGKRDVPLAMYALYHYALAVPHQDKKKMETCLIEAARAGDDAVANFVIVRPTLLTDGPAKGSSCVRAGWEWAKGQVTEEKAPGPRLGYTVSRADVGKWIFEEVIAGGTKWINKCVTLTY